MATYESLIKITGAVGDLVFYNLNGKNVVRKKSGFNKKAFNKNPSYEKVRQNSSEFGHCSKTGKMIRGCLESYIKESGDLLLYQKFARLMTEIKDFDTVSSRGQRTVENGLKTDEGKKLLKEFCFGEKKNLASAVQIKEQNLYTSGNNKADEAIIVTMKLDSQNYTAEYIEETVSLSEKEASFKEQFNKEDFVLYFIALKKKNEIIHMGFV
ncbi:hypothetical protein C1637_15380 [Chryseobacterium lactis]|uniref:Uncharacterized protein n=1 Tax=Chryseobacterium lactis TaxID=1241981 RepID=A0A3G6RFR3_CHRLC|nr:hypothetical protein [Chryseobacterium lactis]AZA83508.1 hypothetical protein EG342_17185 [Chryseobacterium lactis]AZB03892.1 hypothetical protein EG341_08060 [Chryseobacterium lactis]PNW13198.1 hypothetical protein C1637_15380 [Chryseobacterium lactis]